MQETDGKAVVEGATYGNRACSLFRILPFGTYMFDFEKLGMPAVLVVELNPTELITLTVHG